MSIPGCRTPSWPRRQQRSIPLHSRIQEPSKYQLLVSHGAQSKPQSVSLWPRHGAESAAEETLPWVPGELWREQLRAPHRIGEVVAQCSEVATDWTRGNIPLQLNGIVMSPQAEAQLACSSGAPRGAGEHHPRAGRWRGKAHGLWLWPLPGGQDRLCAPTKSR